MKRLAVLVCAATLLSASAPWAATPPPPPPPPSATATISGDVMALAIGYGWGRGVLSFDGHRHPFQITGVTLAGAGAGRFDGYAEVYNLRSLDDFPGLYGVAGSGGAFVTMGRGEAILRNAKGVEIRLHTRDKGLQIHLAAGGAAITLN